MQTFLAARWPEVLIYLGAINLAGLASMGIDKRRARQGAWRVPERTLFILALLGGSAGSLIGMRIFRHKTRHKRFSIGIPLILAAQLSLCAYLLR